MDKLHFWSSDNVFALIRPYTFNCINFVPQLSNEVNFWGYIWHDFESWTIKCIGTKFGQHFFIDCIAPMVTIFHQLPSFLLWFFIKCLDWIKSARYCNSWEMSCNNQSSYPLLVKRQRCLRFLYAVKVCVYLYMSFIIFGDSIFWSLFIVCLYIYIYIYIFIYSLLLWY